MSHHHHHHVLLVLLFACGAQLIAIQAQQSYDTRPPLFKDIINHAIRHANEKARFHLNFFGVLKSEVTSSRFFLTIHLKPTECTKDDKGEHRNDCKFKSGTPFINCAVCGDRSGDTIQEPFIDCRLQPKMNQAAEEERKEKCNITEMFGSKHLLSLKTTEEDAFECLGCF